MRLLACADRTPRRRRRTELRVAAEDGRGRAATSEVTRSIYDCDAQTSLRLKPAGESGLAGQPVCPNPRNRTILRNSVA
jgi:hypothetical protein